MVDITKVHDQFFAKGGPPPGSERPWQYRRPETSLRLAGCHVLADLVRRRLPDRVLDLGSGLTSHVLRSLQSECSIGMIVTTDTEAKWLQRTVEELQRDGLPMEHCYTQEDFATWMRSYTNRFDLISVDCSNLDVRVAMAPDLANWCAPDGVLVLDDWHMRDYGQRMTEALRPFGFETHVVYESRDQYDGYVAIAERP